MRRLAACLLLLATLGCASAGRPRTESYSDPSLGAEMVFVPGGTFERGNTFEGGDDDEKPVAAVTVSSFYLGKTEVTQAQWQAILGTNPSELVDPARPVTNVSWFEVQEFLRKLREKTGRVYRLPTEAEWEYAARSGGRVEQWAGTSDRAALGEVAWWAENSGGRSQPVGGKKPNGLGLHDMTGNVLEWTADWYARYLGRPASDPQGPETGKRKVVRDGSFATPVAGGCRAALRDDALPDFKSFELGFRLARSAQ